MPAQRLALSSSCSVSGSEWARTAAKYDHDHIGGIGTERPQTSVLELGQGGDASNPAARVAHLPTQRIDAPHLPDDQSRVILRLDSAYLRTAIRLPLIIVAHR
jgi:hypothetical protein